MDLVEGQVPVRLSSHEKRAVLDALEALESRVPGFRWETASLFGSRVRLEARGGDIDLYVRVNLAEGLSAQVLKRELRIELEDRLGAQKLDIVLDDGRTDLGVFGKLVLEEKVDLWRKKI
jgi:predicted nucleotidyltransferase